jgi:hypothetical protein
MDLVLIVAAVREKQGSQGGGMAMLWGSHRKEATVCMRQTLTEFALVRALLRKSR